MKYHKITIIFLSILTILPLFLQAQESEQITLRNPEIIEGKLIRISPILSEINNVPDSLGVITRIAKPGYHPKKDWPLHDYVNQNALPYVLDPEIQTEYNSHNKSFKRKGVSFPGIGNTNVDPADPTLDVGPNHVVQMINGGSGSYLKVWDKLGNSLMNRIYFDNISGINGGGDPIVMYDQIADRWLISEFASGWGTNKLIVGISQSPDPTGSWYIYSYTTPGFPDYPKYAIWPEAYLITTNESNGKVYAIDRPTMLTGGSTSTMLAYTIPDYPTIGFQAPTPVSLTGTALPPAGTPAYIMRMADDSWSTSIPNDRLEMWELVVNFQQPSQSTFTGPSFLATDPFDTHLCGYTSFSCFPQPGTNTRLDPLREVLMNRIFYRNFGTHQSIVCNHVTDVDGTDHGGVRWYELRDNGLAWNIYQQSTYSPDNDSRFMASIGINANGDIGLAYNVSSSSTYPSLRYTGRRECDALGKMTLAETTLVAGNGSNYSNRYGDYNTLVVDAGNETDFWFTGMYNPSNSWSTHIGSFNVGSCNVEVAFDNESTSINESDANVSNGCTSYKDYSIKVVLTAPATQAATLFFDLTTTVSSSNKSFQILTDSLVLDDQNMEDYLMVRVFDDAFLEGPDSVLVELILDNNGGDAALGSISIHTIKIADNEALLSPTNNFPETEISNSTVNYLDVNNSIDFLNGSDIILQLLNESNSDFGCTQAEIDRKETDPVLNSIQFINSKSGILGKTYQLTTEYVPSSPKYTLSLFYSKNEIDHWIAESEMGIDSLYIYAIKDFDIKDVNPFNFFQYEVEKIKPQISSWGNDFKLSVEFDELYHSFAVGNDLNTSFPGNEPINIFPNPAYGEIYIHSISDAAIKVRINNTAGQLVKEEDFEEGQIYRKLMIEGVAAGAYFMNVIQGEEVKTFKIIVEDR